jgi:hypothetical protein
MQARSRATVRASIDRTFIRYAGSQPRDRPCIDRTFVRDDRCAGAASRRPIERSFDNRSRAVMAPATSCASSQQTLSRASYAALERKAAGRGPDTVAIDAPRTTGCAMSIT